MSTTTMRKWRAVVTFYSETPDDDAAADDHADWLTTAIEAELNDVAEIASGSVGVPELDTVPEYDDL